MKYNSSSCKGFIGISNVLVVIITRVIFCHVMYINNEKSKYCAGCGLQGTCDMRNMSCMRVYALLDMIAVQLKIDFDWTY